MARSKTLVAAALGYLVGSTPSADIAARLATGGDVDLREAGSGNPGGTNAAQVLGSRWGAAVMAADTVKGTAAAVAGRSVGGDAGAYAAATAAIAGHIFPPWSGFRGGKGVATSAGASLAVFPAYSLLDALVAGASTSLSRRHLELAMTVTCGAWTASAWLWWRRGLPNAWGPRPSAGLFGFALGGSALILGKFWAERRVAGPS